MSLQEELNTHTRYGDYNSDQPAIRLLLESCIELTARVKALEEKLMAYECRTCTKRKAR